MAYDWTQDANCQGAFLFENNLNDSSQGNTLTDAGIVGFSGTSKFGDYSIDCERSTDDYVYHADNLDTDIYGENARITLCGWFAWENYSSAIIGMVAKVSQYGMLLNTNQTVTWTVGGFSEGSDYGSTSNRAISTSSLETGVFTHVCGVLDATHIRIYIDGVNETSTAYTDGIKGAATEFQIGTPVNTRSWDGLIDDVGVFDVALDSTDINDIMDNGLKQATSTIKRRLLMGCGI